MKTLLKFLLFVTLSICLVNVNGQIKINLKDKVNREANKRANNKTDKAVDKTFDKVEEGIGSLFGKKKKKKKDTEATETEEKVEKSAATTTDEVSEAEKETTPKRSWAKFDFVPGDEVIFENAPDIMEENGEFPSRWDLVQGQIEIANVDGENVIMFADGAPMIIPYLKNSKEDYLPDVFTIEFDMYRPGSGNRFQIYLSDRKNQMKEKPQEIQINCKRISVENPNISSDHPALDYSICEKGRWMHISLAFTKGKLKIYMDDTRLINIPHYEFNPTGFTIQAYFADLGDEKPFYLKNIRIAKGGVKYYDRVLSDGKIICNGIRFDINKATLKPESMGSINKIFELMQKKPDLKFSVEGHTDSDGDEKSNQTLSEQRAKAVVAKLIEMGIDKSRLSSKGFGESKPLAGNNTPEGKANNRRVEFVKID